MPGAERQADGAAGGRLTARQREVPGGNPGLKGPRGGLWARFPRRGRMLRARSNFREGAPGIRAGQARTSRMTVWMNLDATIGIGPQRVGLGPDMSIPGFLTCDGEHPA